MKYLFTILTSQQDNERLFKDPSALRKEIGLLVEQLKPEFVVASTIRRAAYILVNIDDPHVKLRKVFESLSKMGTVNVDPVSTIEEFSKFLEAS